jgi:hypothetical protein
VIGFLLLILCVVAAWVTYDSDLFVFAVVNAAINFLSYGVMSNYRKNPTAAPNWAAYVSFLTAVVGVGLLVYGLI